MSTYKELDETNIIEIENKLNILWTNDSILTAEHMLFMYSTYSKQTNLWDEVNIIIWGATAKLTGENKNIQELITKAQSVGVKFYACKACAEEFNVVEILENLDIEVIYMADPLTDIIKRKENLITI